MRVLSAAVDNFGSYEHLEFDFTNQGLTLISGPTGSGKSTLCDIIPWVLFGVTAKGGAVDEVRQWGMKAPTAGQLTLEVNGQKLIISRTRGSNKDNDLSLEWCQTLPEDTIIHRGKDLQDTQKLINEAIGLTAETYLAGAYFHEFSQTAAFFTAPAKTRRQITEQLVDLSQAKKLTETMSEYRKELKKERDETTSKLQQTQAKIDVLNSNIIDLERTCVEWYETHHDRQEALEIKSNNFDREQKKALSKIEEDHVEQIATYQVDMQDLEKEIQPLVNFTATRLALQDHHDSLLKESKCKECGAPKDVGKIMVIKKDLYKLDAEEKANGDKQRQLKLLAQRLESHMKTLEPKLDVERKRKNTYGEQLIALKAETNPHEAFKDKTYADLKVQNTLHDTLTTAVEDLTQELEDVELLLQVTQDLRGVLLTRAVEYLQTQTNKLLTDHFDAEIKVEFDIGSADKLDITIYKDGNICTYSQLSKGQRQMLRLSFGVAVMRCVANNSGVSFSVVALDECLDGFDEATKLKGFTLLETLALEYDTVLAIDHNEAVKAMFTNRYEVTLVNGKSVIEQS